MITMKNNLIIKAIYTMLVIFGLYACQDREIIEVDGITAPVVTDLTAEHVFLDRNFPDNPALTVTWSPATYSVPVEVLYKIEASSTEDFANPYLLGTTSQSERAMTFTVKQLNEASKIIGIPKDVENKMFIRVKSFLGVNQIETASNVTYFSVTPYELVYPTFYLVGAASYVGWDSANAQILYKKENMSYIYTFLQPENFRFLGQQDWNPINYSIDVPETNAANRYFKITSANIIFGDNENMKFTGAAGIYKIAINADKAVQSIEASPSSLGYDYNNLYVVGTLNNWDGASAIEMTKTGEGMFELTTVLTANTELKFLGQKDFLDLEWGNILQNNDGHSGFLGPKGDNSNIKIDGDGSSYLIKVNLKAGTYQITKS